MDHDAMLTDVRKLKEFRAEILALFPGGVVPKPGDRQPPQPGDIADVGEPVAISEELHRKIDRFLDMGDRLERALPALETLVSDLEDVKAHLAETSEAVTALQRAVPEPEKAAGEVSGGAGTDEAAGASGASATFTGVG